MSNINVLVRFESELAAYEAPVSQTIGHVKAEAERRLRIPVGVTSGLTLLHQDRPLNDPGESIQQVLRGASQERIEFRLEFPLIVNTLFKYWARRLINGAAILTLAGSPPDWVVNELVPGPGEDPEIGPDQEVDLSFEAEPKGIKKFKTRKPHTSPGQ